MQRFSSDTPIDDFDRAKEELAQVKDIMVQNVEQILSRGERIELLVDKTDNMAHQATAFRRGARTVRRQQFWRNGKIMVLFVLVGLVCPQIYFMVNPESNFNVSLFYICYWLLHVVLL